MFRVIRSFARHREELLNAVVNLNLKRKKYMWINISSFVSKVIRKLEVIESSLVNSCMFLDHHMEYDQSSGRKFITVLQLFLT